MPSGPLELQTPNPTTVGLKFESGPFTGMYASHLFGPQYPVQRCTVVASSGHPEGLWRPLLGSLTQPRHVRSQPAAPVVLRPLQHAWPWPGVDTQAVTRAPGAWRGIGAPLGSETMARDASMRTASTGAAVLALCIHALLAACGQAAAAAAAAAAARPTVAVSYTVAAATPTAQPIDQVFVVGADGRDPPARQLTSCAHGCVQPSWSPDGTQIVFAELTPQGMELRLMEGGADAGADGRRGRRRRQRRPAELARRHPRRLCPAEQRRARLHRPLPRGRAEGHRRGQRALHRGHATRSSWAAWWGRRTATVRTGRAAERRGRLHAVGLPGRQARRLRVQPHAQCRGWGCPGSPTSRLAPTPGHCLWVPRRSTSKPTAASPQSRRRCRRGRPTGRRSRYDSWRRQ
eukprot:SAG22_NODE_1373_length_4575_cov_10.793789_2_plen_403_part_00